MNIITLTLNPAFDIHCQAKTLSLHHENLARVTDHEAGGKGVNISRALCRNGVKNTALVVLGEENADGFRRRLDEDGIDYRELTVAGRIRENITVHEENAPETRISFTGFSADASLLDRVESLLLPLLSDSSFITFTGRVPDGISMEAVKDFLRRLQSMGARVVIDSRSFSLADLLEMKPYLIKPNQEEISAYLDRTITGFEEIYEAARSLCESGIENVMISLGEQGALLACAEGCFLAEPPQIKALSTIGAGDSSIAGFLSAAAEGATPQDCLCRAVAYGTAACMTPGTRPPEAESVRDVLSRLRVMVY